jgi:hypothetical protein
MARLPVALILALFLLSPAISNAEQFRVALSTKGKTGVTVRDREGRSALLANDHLSFGDPQNNFPVVLYAGKDGPFFNLQDAQGFNVQMGVSRTITKTTGKRLTSSAASLRMFSDKGDLLWSAP